MYVHYLNLGELKLLDVQVLEFTRPVFSTRSLHPYHIAYHAQGMLTRSMCFFAPRKESHVWCGHEARSCRLCFSLFLPVERSLTACNHSPCTSTKGRKAVLQRARNAIIGFAARAQDLFRTPPTIFPFSPDFSAAWQLKLVQEIAVWLWDRTDRQTPGVRNLVHFASV